MARDKEQRYFNSNIVIKEENGEFFSEGFIATTHPDRAFDPELDVEGDILAKQVMDQIAEYINEKVATIDGVGSTRTVSLQHDWVKEKDPDIMPAGMAMPPAEVREMDDGHWGVYVKTHHNKNHPRFKEIIYDVEHGYLPGYSIEYAAGDFNVINHEGKRFRFLKSITNFVGYAFASARKIANPMALIAATSYKELEDKALHDQPEATETAPEETDASIDNKEAINMAEEVKQDTPELEEQKLEEQPEQVEEQAESKEVEETKEEETEEESTELENKEAEEESKPEEVEAKEINVKEFVAKFKESTEFKEAVSELEVESKVMKVKEEKKMEDLTIKEMNSALEKNDIFAYKEAAAEYVTRENILQKAVDNPESYTVGFKSNLDIKCVGKGLRISGKLGVKDTLVVGDNASSYTQANVELPDAFAPGIIDTFNNQTNLFGFLRKEQHVGGSHYQWKMVTNKDPNSNSTFVSQTDVTVAKNFSSKGNYQTPLKIARRGVSVSDFINRYSARSLGDLFMLELDLQMKEMMNDVNAALFAEVADGTGNAPLGLEAVADSAGNTTLYGLTRSVANRLAPTTASDTYLAVGGALTEAAMRTKISYLESEGVRFGDIAIIASPTTRDLMFNLLDGNRRFNTTEAAFGFNRANVPSYDGIPVIVDSDCNSDAIYFIDTSSEGDVIVIGMAPQIIKLDRVGAAVEAYVQMDFAHVYKQPRRIGMLDTLS